MKKLIIFLIQFLICVTISSEGIPKYNMELANTFSRGGEKHELWTTIKAPSQNGPEAITFDGEGNLYISDLLKERLVKYSQTWQYIGEYINGYAWGTGQLFITDNNEFIKINPYSVAIDDSKGNKKASILLYYSEYKNIVPSYPDFTYTDNTVYFRLKDGRLVKIENPGLDNEENLSKAKIIDEAEQFPALEEFLLEENRVNNPSHSIAKLDDKAIIVQKQKVMTRNFDIFFDYWQKKRNISGQRENTVLYEEEVEQTIDLSKIQPSYMTYMGQDADGNYYWDYCMNSMLVFSAKGIILDYFVYDMKKSRTVPAVHPSGDVYFLDYDQYGVYLYKIHRVW